MSGNKPTTFPIELGTAKVTNKGTATYRIAQPSQMRVVTMPASSVQPSGGTTQIIQHIMPQAVLKQVTDQTVRTQIAIPSRTLNQTASITVSRPQTPNTYQIQRGTMTGIAHTPRAAIPLRTQTPPSGLTTNITPTFVRTSIPPRTSSPAAPQWLSTVGPAGSVVQIPNQLITRTLAQSPRARVVTQTIPTSSTGSGTITANVVTQQTLGGNPNSNNQQVVSTGGTGQQQTFVATLAAVLPPRQPTATLVYSTSQQQYSVQPHQRVAMATSIGTTRQVRPTTFQRLPTAGIRVSPAIRAPSVPVLTPTVLASSTVRNTVSTTNLSNTIPARIIQVQPQSNTQVMGGRLHNVMTLQPIVMNTGNRISQTVKPIQPQLTIAQLNKHNIITNASISSGTVTTTSNLTHTGIQQQQPTTNTTTVNLNIGSLQHQQQTVGQQQHATIVPTNLITTNQQQQSQQISFNQTGSNQSHQIVTVSNPGANNNKTSIQNPSPRKDRTYNINYSQVTQHQLMPNQSGTTTVVPLTITSRNTTTIPVNVSIAGLSASGSGVGGGPSTINVIASNSLGGNILRSISTTTTNAGATSTTANILPIAKVLPQQQQQQPQIIGISTGGGGNNSSSVDSQHQGQQQSVVTSLHSLGSVTSGGLWTARSTNATMTIPAHQIGQLTPTTTTSSTISAASASATGILTAMPNNNSNNILVSQQQQIGGSASGFVVGGGSSSSHSGGVSVANNNSNNLNNTINLNNSIATHAQPHSATAFLQTAGNNTTIFYEHIANNNNNNLTSLSGIAVTGNTGNMQQPHHVHHIGHLTPRTSTTTTTTYSTTTPLNQNLMNNTSNNINNSNTINDNNTGNYATIATTTNLNSIFNSLNNNNNNNHNNATAATNTSTLSSNNTSATTNLNQNNTISNIKQIMISSSTSSNNSTSNITSGTVPSGASYKPTAGSFVAVPASNRGQQVHGLTSQLQTVPIRFNPQLLVDNVGGNNNNLQTGSGNNTVVVSAGGGGTTHQIITLQPNLQQGNASNLIIHQQPQQQQQQTQATHMLVPVGSNSGGGSKLTTTTVASSPRSSILRKRDKEGSPIKAARSLTTMIVPITQVSSANQLQHQSLISSMPLIQDRVPSPHSRPGSTDGSTTVSANSSPGADQQEEHEEMYGQNKHLMRLNADGEGYKFSGEMYPPRSYSLQVQHSTSSSSNGNADSMTPRKKPRKQQHATSNENSRPLGGGLGAVGNKDKIMVNNKEMKPHEVTVKKPQTVSLLQCYKQSWKAANNHFQRYSDVRPRDERRPTVIDLANQAHVLQKVNGWKIYHLSAQIEELCELETKAYDNLSDMLKAMETQEKDEEVDRVNELLKGNMQRSKIIVDGITEARSQLMKIFDHKSHVSDIITRCASKRNFKKREKT